MIEKRERTIKHERKKEKEEGEKEESVREGERKTKENLYHVTSVFSNSRHNRNLFIILSFSVAGLRPFWGVVVRNLCFEMYTN